MALSPDDSIINIVLIIVIIIIFLPLVNIIPREFKN